MTAKQLTAKISDLANKKNELEAQLYAVKTQARDQFLSDLLDLIESYDCGVRYSPVVYDDSMEFTITNKDFDQVEAGDIYDAYEARRRGRKGSNKK